MKLSYICPTQYIKEFQGQSDFILALAHLIDLNSINAYEQAILDTKLPIWLDNSCFEQKMPVGIDELVLKAKKIGAELLVAPDFLYNKKSTQRAIANTRYIMKRHNFDCKMMVVCQAKTKTEYLQFYKELCENDQVDVIGLSILAIPHVYSTTNQTKCRIEFMQDCLKMQDVNHKQCHLLGAGNTFEDALFAKQYCPWIKSNDSSSAFWHGIQLQKINEQLEVEGGKTQVKVNFDFKHADAKQLRLAQKNIDILKQQLS